MPPDPRQPPFTFEAPAGAPPYGGRYTPPAVWLHWLIAALIVVAFTIVLSIADMPGGPAKGLYFNWHKWTGLTVLWLVAVRLVWRLTHPRPPEPPIKPWEFWLSRLVQGGLYGLMFAIPLLGWATTSAGGRPLTYLGLFPLPALMGPDKALAHQLGGIHGTLAWTLAALVGLHAAGALKHHFVDRNGFLKRMA